jgi:8-oxo-dGTP pyrophosphatase MutT (NUDIX family)
MSERLWKGLTKALAPQSEALTQAGPFHRQAAVMALITDSPSPELIFTLRAKHLSHHAGEVCFPGGMWEPQDDSLLASALRETHEEIGVPHSMIDVLGALPLRPTRSGTLVRPYVGRISTHVRFNINQHELDTLFTVPLAEFRHGLQIRMDTFQRDGHHYRIPAYSYQGFEIWGFTAAVTAELLALVQPLSSSEFI